MSVEAEIRVVYVEDDERLARLTTQYLASHQVEVHLVPRVSKPFLSRELLAWAGGRDLGESPSATSHDR